MCIGALILLVDADIIILKDCLHGVAREFVEPESQELAVLLHESGGCLILVRLWQIHIFHTRHHAGRTLLL